MVNALRRGGQGLDSQMLARTSSPEHFQTVRKERSFRLLGTIAKFGQVSQCRGLNRVFLLRVFAVLGIGHILFIQSSADGHLGCCHCLALKNNAAMNICV